MTGPRPGAGDGETSRLLDLRDCDLPGWAAVHREMLRLDLEQQPRWFRPWLRRSRRLQRATGYDHWSRSWEYPWAIRAAGLPGADGRGDPPDDTGRLRVLDVGGGGSPFSLYLAARGHEAWVADPSLDQGTSFVFDRGRGPVRNLRSLLKRSLFRALGLNSLWGLPERRRGAGTAAAVRRLPCPADRLDLADASFDRVFCLSVMEHIPVAGWPACMAEFERVLRPGGRLVITLDMTTPEADARHYRRLVEVSALRLLGDPSYPVPLAADEQRRRHPGHGYETIGLAWIK
ncbi:MAG: class I SAM-dependent methyltransferase [Candidatus Polarisedimenticolia bacterium]